MKEKMLNLLKWLKNNLFYIIVGAILIMYSLSIVLSLLWAFSVTLKPYSEYIMTPFDFPKELRFDNWVNVINDFRIPKSESLEWIYVEEMFFNSIVYALACSVTNAFMQCVASYLTSKYKFRFGKIVYGVVIVTMIMPIVGSLPSEIQMLKALGLYDTLFGLVVLKANCLGMYFLVFYAIFKSISWSYAESAFMDGANHFTVFFRIMLPLVKTTFFAIVLLNFIMYWNDYQGPMIYWSSHPTIAYGLYYKKAVPTGSFSKEPMQITGCMLMTLPILIVFVLFQKRLMSNLTIGGIKG